MVVQNVTVHVVNLNLLIIGRKPAVYVHADQVNEWFMVPKKTIFRLLAIHAKKKSIPSAFETYVHADYAMPVSRQTMLSKAQLRALHANHVQ